jgi:hypothetical protein
MKSRSIHDETLGDVEDTWWPSTYPGQITYRSLPDTSKWLCRTENTTGRGPSRLTVFASRNFYHFPGSYTSIFMLLDLHHLSSLAEAIRLPCSSSEVIRHIKNVHFLNQLRLHILSTHNDSSEFQDEGVSNLYLIRWVLRLVHKIPNSKTLRKSKAQEISEIYQRFEKEKDGIWKMGENHLLRSKLWLTKIQPFTSG